jgi:iron-sulfur cluster repair protein YtfE (RIC family)
MYLYNLDVMSDQSLPPTELCDVLETKYHAEIKQSCRIIKQYLLENEEIRDVRGSVSDLVHLMFYKLDDEINKFLLKEKREIFPLMIQAFEEGQCEMDEDEIESIKETHLLILKIVQRLRQLLCNYVVKPAWSNWFKECVCEFYRLENKIYKWIHLKENYLFTKVVSVGAQEQYSATVSLI